jgi:hypothetical protein
MRQNPRINSALVNAIRMVRCVFGCACAPQTCAVRNLRTRCVVLTATYACQAKRGERQPSAAAAAAKLANEQRPDEAFTTERAVRAGKANASSGRIFVTIPQDHFGPIPASADPLRNQGVLVGETWGDRLECRQWGAHFPHVAGIAGQSSQGAQSVALSGGCVLAPTAGRLQCCASCDTVCLRDGTGLRRTYLRHRQVRGRRGQRRVVPVHGQRRPRLKRQQADEQAAVVRSDV